MRARPLLLAAALTALGFAAVRWWWAPGAMAGAALLVAWLGERFLAPITAADRAAWPQRPPLGLDPTGVREGLTVTARVLRCATPLCVLLLLGLIAWIRLSGATEAELERLPADIRSLDELPSFLWRACLIAPLFEEFLWRGLVQQHLERALGAWPAILLGGVLFWMMHWIPFGGPTPPNQLIGGWVIGWSWYRTRGLVAPILLHAIGNGAIAALGALWIARPPWLRALLGFE